MKLDNMALTRKVRAGEILTQEESLALLKELEHFKLACAYLASCQAATLESLPKSASKRCRSRHVQITSNAAKLLNGDASGIKHQVDQEWAANRCDEACNALT